MKYILTENTLETLLNEITGCPSTIGLEECQECEENCFICWKRALVESGEMEITED